MYTCTLSTFLCDVVPFLGCCQKAFDEVAPLEDDLDPYLTTSVLDTFTETLAIRYHHVYVIVIVVGDVGAGVTTPATGVGLCVAISMVVLGFKSVEGPCRVLAPG